MFCRLGTQLICLIFGLMLTACAELEAARTSDTEGSALTPHLTESMRSQAVGGEALLVQASALIDAGRLRDAERMLRRAENRAAGTEKPGRIGILRGRLALARRQFGAAETHFRKAVAGDPRNWRGWLGAGQAADGLGAFDRAGTAYKRALSLRPDHPVVLNDIAMSSIRQDRPKEAIRHLQKALRLRPGFALAAANLRIARAMTGAYDDAVARASPDALPDILNNVGYIALSKGDYHVAERLLSRAMQESPVYHETAADNLAELRRRMRQAAVGEASP